MTLTPRLLISLILSFISFHLVNSQDISIESNQHEPDSNTIKLFPKIIQIEGKDNERIVNIDKGSNTKTYGGKPKLGDEYSLLITKNRVTSLSNEKVKERLEKIGTIFITQTEQDSSRGILKLSSNISNERIIKESVLKQMADRKGCEFGIGIHIGMPMAIKNRYPGGSSFGIFVRGGYHFNHWLNIGLGTGIYKEHINLYSDGFYKRTQVYLPLYFSSDIIFSKHYTRPFFTCNLGSYIYREFRYIEDGKYYFEGTYLMLGFGLRFHLTSTYGISFYIADQYIGNYGYIDEEFRHLNTLSLNMNFFF